MKLPEALVVMALVVGAAACGGADEEGYSPEVERNLVQRCVDRSIEAGDGAAIEAEKREYCSCTYDEIEASGLFEEFAEGDRPTREDEDTPLSSKLDAIVAKCLAEQGYSARLEKTFVAGCVESSRDEGVSVAKARGFCSCSFAEFKAKIPFEEFAEYDAKTRKDLSAEPPPKMAAVAERCKASVG